MEQSNVEVTNYSGVRLHRYNKVIYYGVGDECRYDRFIPYVVRKGLIRIDGRCQYHHGWHIIIPNGNTVVG